MAKPEELVGTGAVKALLRLGNLASKHHMSEEALQMQKAASAARPESDVPFMNMGLTHLNMGNFPEAIEMLRDKALKLNPGRAATKAFLGLALKLSGEKDEADSMLKEVSENADDPDVAGVAKKTLEQDLEVKKD